MNLLHLESLVWVARLKSFNAAATRLNITQPAVSLRIQQLEKELGVRLLDRAQRAVTLTVDGRECLAYAEHIMAWVAELRGRAGGRESVRGRVSLGVNELVAHTWLPELLTVIGSKYPDLHIDTDVQMTPRLLQGLEAGEYDVTLLGTHRLATTFAVCSLGRLRFRWMEKPTGKRFRQPLTPRDFQDRRVITWSKDAAIYRLVENWFTRNGAYPKQRITCNTAVTMAALAAAGLGVTLLPRELVKRELATGMLRVIPVKPELEPLQYYAVYAPMREGSQARLVAETAGEVSNFPSRSLK
jgi:DNA-binding transcriptional LysR family regulator